MSIDPFDEKTASEVSTLLNYAEKNHAPIPLQIDGGVKPNSPTLVAVPAGLEVQDIARLADPYLAKPRELKGIARLTDEESFITHVERFKDDDSVIFADRSESHPEMTAVYDYHIAHGDPRWGRHKALYSFPTSPEWQTWRKSDSCKLDQSEFARFIENNIGDVIQPPAEGDTDNEAAKEAWRIAALLNMTMAGPSRVMELSRGLTVNVKSVVTNNTIMQSGEGELHFESEHETKVKVPGMFLIGIPVFEGGPIYQMAVLLRYRVREGNISWWYELYRPDLTFFAAFDSVVEDVAIGTNLPILFGSPEG